MKLYATFHSPNDPFEVEIKKIRFYNSNAFAITDEHDKPWGFSFKGTAPENENHVYIEAIIITNDSLNFKLKNNLRNYSPRAIIK